MGRRALTLLQHHFLVAKAVMAGVPLILSLEMVEMAVSGEAEVAGVGHLQMVQAILPVQGEMAGMGLR